MIVGAGGWGREAVWTLERINAREETWNILGFADDDPAKASGSVEGYPLLGPVEKASRDYPGAAVYIAIGDNAVRESIYRRLRGHDFPVIIDPSADVAPTAELRHGVFIGPQAVVSVGAELGKFAIVCSRAGVGHDTSMGDFAMLRPAATLLGHMSVGSRAYIAAGVVVRRNVGDGETLSAT
jgi:sugar O-acyltransferase (sialic acid O-acetyltransferase NeuD family)